MRQVLIIFPKALCGLEAIILPCKKKKKMHASNFQWRQNINCPLCARAHTQTHACLPQGNKSQCEMQPVARSR